MTLDPVHIGMISLMMESGPDGEIAYREIGGQVVLDRELIMKGIIAWIANLL